MLCQVSIEQVLRAKVHEAVVDWANADALKVFQRPLLKNLTATYQTRNLVLNGGLEGVSAGGALAAGAAVACS